MACGGWVVQPYKVVVGDGWWWGTGGVVGWLLREKHEYRKFLRLYIYIYIQRLSARGARPKSIKTQPVNRRSKLGCIQRLAILIV